MVETYLCYLTSSKRNASWDCSPSLPAAPALKPPTKKERNERKNHTLSPLAAGSCGFGGKPRTAAVRCTVECRRGVSARLCSFGAGVLGHGVEPPALPPTPVLLSPLDSRGQRAAELRGCPRQSACV